MDNEKENLAMLIEDECPHNRYGFCKLTGRSCHITDALPDANSIADLDCIDFIDEHLPPDWELVDLLAYANLYAGEMEE